MIHYSVGYILYFISIFSPARGGLYRVKELSLRTKTMALTIVRLVKHCLPPDEHFLFASRPPTRLLAGSPPALLTSGRAHAVLLATVGRLHSSSPTARPKSSSLAARAPAARRRPTPYSSPSTRPSHLAAARTPQLGLARQID